MLFSNSWLIRIGGSLVVSTTILLILLSFGEFAFHLRGPLAAIALCSYLAGSMGMIMLCLGAIQVLMRRRRIE